MDLSLIVTSRKYYIDFKHVLIDVPLVTATYATQTSQTVEK